MIQDEIYEHIKDLFVEPINILYLWNDDEDKYYEEAINRLIALHDQTINDWLWNALVVNEKEYSIENSSLIEDAKTFVKKYVDEKNKWMSSVVYGSKDINRQILIGINEPIIGERIILKPCQTKDNCDLYLYHVKNDGDVKLYATPTNSSSFSENCLKINTKLPNSFYVCLKENEEEIGVVSLFDNWQRHNCLLTVAKAHYYIYKEYRHKGYAKEAMRLIIDAFFNSSLKQYVATDKRYVFVAKYCEPLCIKLSCNKDNMASNKLALKLGFIFEGTDHYNSFMDGVPQDENNYYLDLNSYKNSKVNI